MGSHRPPQAPRAAEAIARLREDPFDEQAFYLLGCAYLEEGSNLEAAANFRRAVELNPEFVEAWEGLARAYRQAGVEKEAAIAEEKVRMLGSSKWL